jgi:hypothetical protein
VWEEEVAVVEEGAGFGDDQEGEDGPCEVRLDEEWEGGRIQEEG